MRDIRKEKMKKLFFSIIVSVFFSQFFTLPHVVYATPQPLVPTQPCVGLRPNENQRIAIFGITTSGSYSHPNLTEHCMLVDKNATTVSFSELARAGVLEQAWAGHTIFEEYTQCGGAESFDDNVIGDSYSFYNRDVGEAQSVSYKLSQYISLCDPPKDVLVRYEIPTGLLYAPAEDHRFFYFLGFEGEKGGAVQACDTYNAQGGVACNASASCFWLPADSGGSCQSRLDRSLCASLPQNLCGTGTGSAACQWNRSSNRCISAIEGQQASEHRKPEGYIGPIPDCAFEGTCNDVNDLLRLIVNYGRGTFGIVGTFALAFFVYGGFVIVTSFGNPERVKKGRDILVAAVIGILICFSAYAVIGFLLNALQVGGEFRVIQ